MIYDIINELNENNSTNYKIEVLKKHKDNKLLQRVLKMTYDKAIYSYGITMKMLFIHQKKIILKMIFH